jgi:hypothetical protein
MALLAGLGLTGLAITSSIIHRRVPNIVGQASDRWRQHPRCGAALPDGLFNPDGNPDSAFDAGYRFILAGADR